MLRIGLGADQEHRVNHEARAADRTKVPAEVIQLAAHEVDPKPDKAESAVGSESASDSEQNDPPSSLASDAEQYELMQASYVAVGKDFHDQEDLIGSEYSKLQRLELAPGEAVLFPAKIIGWVLLGSPCNTSSPPRIIIFFSPSG